MKRLIVALLIVAAGAGALSPSPSLRLASAPSAPGTVHKDGCTVTIGKPTLSPKTTVQHVPVIPLGPSPMPLPTNGTVQTMVIGTMFANGSVRCNKTHRNVTVTETLAFFVPVSWVPRVKTAHGKITKNKTGRIQLGEACEANSGPTMWRARLVVSFRQAGKTITITTPWRQATTNCK